MSRAKKRCICPDRRDSATLHFTLKTNLASSIGIFGLILLVFPIFLPAQARAAGNAADAKLSIFVDCHCSDPVGGDFCSALKDKIADAAAYRLGDHTDALGIGVHPCGVAVFAGVLG